MVIANLQFHFPFFSDFIGIMKVFPLWSIILQLYFFCISVFSWNIF